MNRFQAVLAYVGLILVIVALLRFKDSRIAVDPNSNSVIAITSTWWGLKKVEHEIRWMKTDQYDSPGWMTKGPNGEWYLYIYDDLGPSEGR